MNSEKLPPCGKLIYVKKQLLSEMQKKPQPKVLLNPVFKPHFNKNFLIPQYIHVNPSYFSKTELKSEESTNNKSLWNYSNKFVTEEKPKLPPEHRQTLVSSRTKLIKAPQKENQVKNLPLSIKNKVNAQDEIRNVARKPIPNIHNRFKLDYRNSTKRHILHTKQKSPFKNKILVNTSKNEYLKRNTTSNYVNKNGVLYKKGLRSLSVVKRIESNLKQYQDKVITIRKENYKLDKNRRTLTLISKITDQSQDKRKSINIGGVTFKRKEPNVYVKVNNNAKRILSQAKFRSINILRNKHKKSNIPCPFYRKFGRCKGKELGTCIRKHNPEQIMLCKKFLQGACINDKCLLSHRFSASNMPTCKFFLEGLCSKENCPYSHIYMNPKAEICQDFLAGFCKLAADCCKRHQFLCPEFEKTGKCVKVKCPYRHQKVKVVRKPQLSKPIATTIPTKAKSELISENKEIVKNLPSTNKKEMACRYYDHSLSIVNSDNEETNDETSKSRQSIGELPSFIAF